MAVDDATIQAWLQQNAGASDADIRSAMDQYGVDTSQMARATGMDYETMQSRYDGAGGGLLGQANTAAPKDTYTDDQVRSWVSQYIDVKNPKGSLQPELTRLAKDMQQYGVGFEQMGRILGLQAFGGQNNDSVENLYAVGFNGVYNRNAGHGLGQGGAARDAKLTSEFNAVKGDPAKTLEWMKANNVSLDDALRISGTNMTMPQFSLWVNGLTGGTGTGHMTPEMIAQYKANGYSDEAIRQKSFWSGGFDDYSKKVFNLTNSRTDPNDKFATGGSAPRGTTPNTGGVTPLPGGGSGPSPGGPGPGATSPGGPTLPGTGGGDPVSNPAGPNWRVDDPQTVEGRLNNLLKTDDGGTYTNPVIRQAVDRALQAFNGRGLLNSSMAQQAAQEAAISKATEIAKSDAETYAAAAKQNAQNAWQGGENSTNRQWQSGENNANRNLDWQKAWLNAETSLKQSNISQSTQVEIAEMNRKYAQQANNSQAVSSLLQQYNSSVTRITESDLTVEAKEAALRQYKQVFMSGVKLIGSINGDTSFEELLNSLFPNG